MKKLNKNSLDIVKQNIEKLKEIFPDVFSEDKIDFEKLRENLGEFVEESDEKYQFTWFGKKKANQLALTSTKATLRAAKNESKNWETTKNIYIEGDNLEVLKVLQKAYYKKIKMIYIDPPYNKNADVIYKDDYSDNLKNYLTLTGQVDEEGNPLTTNTETSGRRHSNWLNMMYPRLKLARNLLRDDGVIFISIDDNEVANLRKIMDEIFGEENFVANFVWTGKSGSEDDGDIRNNHEYILCYSKNIDKFNVGLDVKNDEKFPYYDEQRKKFYKRQLLRKWGDNSRKEDRPNLYYPIYTPDGKEFFPMLPDGSEGCWRWSKEKMNEAIKNNLIEFVKNKKGRLEAYEKIYEDDKNKSFKKFQSLLDNASSTSNGTKEIKNLFDLKIFDRPKPTKLINILLKIANTSTSDLILDFFSGSATTAHAVMELNAEDGGERQFILVQLPEPTDEKSEAYKAGYKNICEIGKERIRRAGEKIKEDYKDKEWIDNFDIGFKVFKLDSTNIKEWDSNPDNLEKSLLDYEEFIKEDRSEEDLLYEVLLKYGIDLTAPIEEKEVNGKKIYIVGFGKLIIYFDEIDTQIAKEIVNLVKEKRSDFSVLVLKDDSFVSSQDKVNIIEFFKQMNLFEKIITL